MALRAGFFNALKDASTGDYDRKYNADDYSNFLSAFIRDGVRRGAEDDISDLKVTVSDRTISVAKGFAMVLGKWVENTSTYTFTDAIELPASGQSRIDRICIQVDKAFDREPSFNWKIGTSTATTPTAPELINNENVKEICLAELLISSTGVITINDTRGNKDLCGWITTPVGYDDFFTAYDENFSNWFQGKKDTLASVTLFKEYHDRIITTTATSTVVFNIPQYDPTGVDIVQVYTNGIREVEGIDYSLSGSTITFLTTGGGTGTKVAGTEIQVYVYKSIDGTGLKSVSDEITALQNSVNALADMSEYNYFCTGSNDNIAISNICSTFLAGGTDYKQMRLNVYGTLGISTAASGDGTALRPYTYFNLGKATTQNRKIIVNFANAERFTINAEGTYATIFGGSDVFIENANVNVISTSNVNFFTGERITASDCEFYGTATGDIICGKCCGTFTNCKVSITSQTGNAFCFYGNGNLLRVNGGNYYCWTSDNSKESVCFYVEASQTENVFMLNGVNCPQYSRSGYYQTDTVKINHGYASLNGCFWKEPDIYDAGLTSGNVTKNGVMIISKQIP